MEALDREWDAEESEASLLETRDDCPRRIIGAREAPAPYDPLLGEVPSVVGLD